MAAVPEVFNQPGAGFVLLSKGIKFPPIEDGWQKPEKAHTFHEATAHRGNVGILAGNGFVGFDKDDPGAFDGLELPATTLWETRPGRYGLWFRVCDDVSAALSSIGKKPDLAQLKLFKAGKPCGEIKLQRTYQVIPPSWKTLEDGSRADYRLLDSDPPAEISLAKLLADLQANGITFRSRLEKNTAKLEKMAREAKQRRIEQDESRTRAYALAALRDEVLALASTPEGSRNEQLNRSAFVLGQFITTGGLAEAEVVSELTRAAENTGLDSEEIARTIRSGLGSGRQHPREIPDKPISEQADTEVDEEANPEIRAAALKIMHHGDPVEYILDTLSVYHAGDRRSAELLLCSVAIGNILNANGTQPKLSGGSGKGKTHLCKALRHLMPPEWVLFTSLSPKAIYYDPQIKPGMAIFSDDVRISEDLEDTLKRAMSNFQEPSPYRVVNKDRSLETRYLPERLIWWLTSVEDDQEEQLINRFFSVGVDESEKQDLASLKLTFAPLAEGRREFPVTESVRICRAIIQEVKAQAWMVQAPFLVDGHGDLNISWRNPEDRRNPGRFADLLAAYAVLRSGQRNTREEDGYRLVVATHEDFMSAKDLYESRAENLATKLDDRELHFIRWLKEKAGNRVYEFKINDVAKTYRGGDGKGLSPKTLERMLIGRKDRNSYGLIDKIRSGGLTVEVRSETEPIDDDGSRKRQTRYNLFAFDPAKFNLLESYSNVVSLKTDSNRPDPDGPRPDPGIGSDPSDPLDIDMDYNRDREDPKDPKDTEKPPVEGSSPKSSLSLKVGSSGSFGSDGEPDADLLGSGRGSGRGSDQAGAQKGIGPHPRREELPRLKAIYVSSGPAREYAEYSLNLHNGCSHGCQYCYAKKRFSGDCTTRVKKARLENIEADLKGWKGERKPVHLTFMGDPYDLVREDNSDVRSVLELFKKYRHPFQVLTKGGEKAIDDFDLYFEGCRFGCTLTFMDEKDSRNWEPGAALPIGRIAALKEAHDRGIETWVSLEPIIDPCHTLALIDASHKYVDFYGVGKWNHDPTANGIVWPRVRSEVEARLKKYGKTYMIKEALRKATPDTDSNDSNADNSEKIRAAAMMEYGMCGWVDPAKLSKTLKLPLQEVEVWLQDNYVAFDRPGGGLGYRQRKAGEGVPA